MARPDQDIVPHNYVVVRQTTECQHCHAKHELSMITAKTYLHSRMTGRPFANQRPVRHPNEISHNLPIEIENRPVEQIPFCHECFATVSLAHLPPPPTAAQAPRPVVPSWMGGGTQPEPKTKKPSKPFTIDDL